jgi:hypothetical protein
LFKILYFILKIISFVTTFNIFSWFLFIFYFDLKYHFIKLN